MGIEPTQQLFTAALVLKTRRPTRRLGTSDWFDILTHNTSLCNTSLSSEARPEDSNG